MISSKDKLDPKRQNRTFVCLSVLLIYDEKNPNNHCDAPSVAIRYQVFDSNRNHEKEHPEKNQKSIASRFF
jgi:hypothetical protein